MRQLCLLAILVFGLFSSFAQAQLINDLAKFLGLSRNPPYSIPAGATGKVQRLVELSSGNYGLQLQMADGAFANQLVWIPFSESLDNPGVQFFNNATDLAGNKPSHDITDHSLAKLTQSMPAFRDPNSKVLPKASAESLVDKIQSCNKVVKNSGTQKSPCDRCANPGSSDACPEEEVAQAPESKSWNEGPTLRPPKAGKNPYNGFACSIPLTLEEMALPENLERNKYYTPCKFDGESEVGQFSFLNLGPNNIVSSKGQEKVAVRTRQWSFSFQGNVAQDINISVMDGEDSQSVMMFFPRKTLPTIRVEGKKKIVTLPTGETVTYDALTSEVIGGAFKERPVSNSAPKVSYEGSGLMVRVDTNRRIDPRMGKLATISKQGKSCTVPAADLWPDRRESSSLHFKFSTDDEFNKYLNTKCGFGI